MTRILVIGASRGIGRETVRAGLAAGHEIRAMARDADALDLDDPRLEKASGDATDPGDLARAVAGVDAVVIALGVKLGTDAILRRVSLFSDATAAIIPAMQAAGVRRLIAVTGFGAGECAEKISYLEYAPFKAVLGRAYDDKTRQETMIKESDLDWTIVRPGILTNGKGRGRYKVLVEKESWHNGLIARADVARFIIGEIAAPAHLRQAPVLVY